MKIKALELSALKVSHLLIINHNFEQNIIGKFNFQRYFFNEVEHLQHQNNGSCYIFYWQNIDTLYVDARFCIIIQDNVAYSPRKATFGGIEFSTQLTEKDLFSFILEVKKHLSSLNLESIVINSYPEGYLSEEQKERLNICLDKLNFTIKYIEHNYEIIITDKSFYEIVKSKRAKQLLRKADKNGFIFQKEGTPDLARIHAFIARSRIRKNRPMTMTLEQFTEHFQKFPDNFQAFSVNTFKNIIAIGITIKISENIIYTFYLADDENSLKDSPTIFLLSGIYEYAQQKKFQILDLGIVTNKGILNEGLARFKRSLGGKLSHKKTYFRNF